MAKRLWGPAVVKTVINADASELPATHIGWNGRLNGPVDNSSAPAWAVT
jgi:hypothetical protein